MPTYLFHCENCSTLTQERASMQGIPIAIACPKCGRLIGRVFSAPMLNGMRHPERIRDEQAVHVMRANEYAEDKAHAKWAEKPMQKLD